ncbi:MAG: VOC family protein [Proteobacteria bacterium]|nr:VOC family protein [Pseudomonadota bacterium]
MDGQTQQEPTLKLNFLSHGTLEARDLEKSRAFYEEFLGLEVVRTSNVSLLIRLGGDNTIAVVQVPKKESMPLLNHNGFDVETQEEVDAAHVLVEEHAEKWGIGKVTKPALQHGTYSFFFSDLDDNWWEILTNPPRGYAWLFEKGEQQGRGHMDKKFERPGLKTEA